MYCNGMKSTIVKSTIVIRHCASMAPVPEFREALIARTGGGASTAREGCEPTLSSVKQAVCNGSPKRAGDAQEGDISDVMFICMLLVGMRCIVGLSFLYRVTCSFAPHAPAGWYDDRR